MKGFPQPAPGGGDSWFRLEVPSNRDVLPWVSHGFRGFLRATGWTRRDAFRLDLAVNEAVDNAIRHGNAGDPSLHVHLTVRDDGGSIFVEVVDRGRGFNPDAVQPVHERNARLQEGGRGVELMRRLMDEIEVECGPEGTRVRMRKVRPHADLKKAG